MPAPAPVAMQTYYAGAGGGCFGDRSTVVVLRGDEEVVTRVGEVKKGDLVKVRALSTQSSCGDVQQEDNFATVVCVAEIKRSSHKSLFSIGGSSIPTPTPNMDSTVVQKAAYITSKHPIRVGGQWTTPSALAAIKSTATRFTNLNANDNTVVNEDTTNNATGEDVVVEAEEKVNCNDNGVVYNFVLDRCHNLLVGDVECVTWGHHIDDVAVRHFFYGTGTVVESLKRLGLTGWDQGRVVVNGAWRDENGHVVGFF